MTTNSIKKKVMYFLLSFFVPFAIIMLALIGLKITPFGNNTLAISDGDALYLNYLGYVARTFQGKEDILFSFEKGLGGNMMGSWGWFLINPFFIIFSFFDITNYMQAYTWVSVLNFSLCGFTMYLLLKNCYGVKSSSLIFSTAYAMNGFLVANVFQVNFFTGVAALPIMILGLRKILQDRSPLIYIISLAYALFSNFYFGFMLCVSSVLMFTLYLVIYRRDIDNKSIIVGKYIVSSILAGALSSVVWLPAFLSLRGGRLDQSIAYAITLRENMPFLDMFAKLFSGANTTTELRDGLPNIFVGIIPLLLAIVFFIDNKNDKKKKIYAGSLLVFYAISFYLPVINIAMHGGTTTNWFNYRDSFVICLFLLLVAADEWQYVTEDSGHILKKSVIALLLLSIIVFSKSYEFVTGGNVLIDYTILVLMLIAFLMYKRDPIRNSKHMLSLVVLILTCLNMFINYYYCTKNILEWGEKESEYQEVVLPVSTIVDSVKNSDSTFFRMEIGEQRSGNLGNDPMLYGYNGVGHGGSDDRNFVRTGLSKLGIRRFDMRNSYGQGITGATDSLLGLKYIISKENLTEEKGYKKRVEIGGWVLYENPNVLPVSTVVDSEVVDLEIDIEDIFNNLNRVWTSMTGIDEKVFEEEESIQFIMHNITDSVSLSQTEAKKIVTSRDEEQASNVSSDNARAPYDSDLNSESYSDDESTEYIERGTLRDKPENMNYIMYTFTASEDGAVYSYNRSGMTENNGSAVPMLNYEGYYHKGDTVTRYIPMENTMVTEYLLEEVAGRFKVAYINEDVLARMSQTILDRPSTIDRITDSHLKGTFVNDEGQTLMFTIPYDEGWNLTVDGKTVDLKKALDLFMVADVEPGEHIYEMKFVPGGLKLGLLITSLGTLLSVCYILLDYKRRRKLTYCKTERVEEG